jgi:replicative DNA helicase
MSVIGSLLLGGKKAFIEVAHKLKPEHFYSDIYRDSYKIISEGQFRDSNVDMPIIIDKLHAKGWTTQEIRKWLVEGMDLISTVALVSGYADIVINNYKAREADKLIKSTALHADGIDEQLTDLTSKLNDLKQDTGKRKTQLISDFLLPVYETFFEERDPRTVYTGFSKLDAIIGGIEPTDYCLIAARPGVGKTAIATNILLNVAKQGRKPTLFTMEMAKEQVIERMVSTLSNVSLSVIRDRKQIKEHEQTAKAIAQAATQLDKLPIYINDSGSVSPLDVLSEISVLDTDLIIIDHLGLMQSAGKAENRNQEVSKISRDLRLIALQKQTPIIALNQLNRANEVRANKKPILSDLRDSGSLEQDATQVIFLSPYDKIDDGIYVEVAKNRQGQSGTGVVFRFYKQTQTFYETEFRYEEPKEKRKKFGGL